MNHQPFDTWLLEDKPLTADQKRELQAHLQACARCGALAETGVALHAARERGLAAPAAGFTLRFRGRLAVHKQAERRRRSIGMLIFVIGGLSLLAGLSLTLLAPLFAAPAEWIALALSYVFFLTAALQALGDVGQMLLRVAPGFVPPFMWLVVASTLAGVGLLWVVSVWRLTYVPRGV
jgi:anti-sigma factor RsiW